MKTTFYVSTFGDDGWSGSLPEPNAAGTDGPFATLERAVEASRAVGASVPRGIIVRGGVYYDVAIRFDDRDSGLTIEAAEAEEPILYGGRPIEGWVQEGKFWTADLPEVAAGSWDFRMLQVNGRMCPRARLPKEGTFTHENVFSVRWMTSTGGGWEREPTEEELTTLRYKEGDLGPWLDVNNAELTVYHAWDDSMVGISAIDPEHRVLTFSTPTGHPPGGFGSWVPHANTYVVWNVREGLTEPGQWFLDRTAGKVVYWPLPGESLSSVQAIAPTTERIIEVVGRSGAPVAGLTLQGLTLSVTHTPLVAASFGTERLDGAITGMAPLVDCQFLNLVIRNVAGNGIKLRDQVRSRSEVGARRVRPSENRGIRIERCEVRTIGAEGIYLTAQDSAITDNLVAHVGVMYPAAIGVRFTGDRIEVSHNEMRNTSYSAVAGHFGKGARVEYNSFSDVMQVLRDGAAIYVFYVEELVMRGNVTTASKGSVTRAHAYYLDEFSENCEVAENLAVDMGWPLHNHMGQNNRIWGNVLISHGDVHVTFPRSSGFSMERNVIYAGGKIVLDGINAIVELADNVFYSKIGDVVGIEQEIYTPGGPIVSLRLNPDAQIGQEYPLKSGGGILLADPLLIDLDGGDYRFRAGSPALRLGIQPIDVSRAGRRI